MRDIKCAPDASPEEKKRLEREAFEGMLNAFHTKINESRVMNEVKRRQYHETKGEKRRRKIKENRKYRSN
jgi:ribosomal protein S21